MKTIAVYEEGHLTNNLDRIVERWIVEYISLYNTEHNSDNKYIKEYISSELKSDGNEENIMLNEPLSFNEVQFAITYKKSSGVDNIPNEVFKSHEIRMHGSRGMVTCNYVSYS